MGGSFWLFINFARKKRRCFSKDHSGFFINMRECILAKILFNRNKTDIAPLFDLAHLLLVNLY